MPLGTNVNSHVVPYGMEAPPSLPRMKPRHTDTDREINDRISARLRKVLQEFDVNQTEMAKALGCDPSYISRGTRSERGFSASFVVKLCQAYGLDPRVVLLGASSEQERAQQGARDPGDASAGQARPVRQKLKGGGMA